MVANETKESLDELAKTAVARNWHIGDALRPGLSRREIEGHLRRANVRGQILALLALYSWANGMLVMPRSLLDANLLPDSPYRFLDLETAIEHYQGLQQTAKSLAEYTGDPTAIRKGIARYFPVFWDEVTGYVAIDLQPTKQNGIVLLELESERPFEEAYRTFDEFVRDAIESNRTNRRLTCFE